MALGAQARDVLRLVVWHGMKLVLLGLAVGAVSGYGLKRLLATEYFAEEAWQRQVAEQLYGVTGTDPLTFGVIASLLRCREFYDVHFRWDENAYGSVVWTILGLHLIYILTGIAEFALMAAFAARHGFEEKHGLDVTLMGGFWYWLAGIWVITYVIIYWYPRWS